MEYDHIACCGINCEACSVLQFGLGNTKDTFIGCCGSIPVSELKCGGCRSDFVYSGCRTCDIRKCALNRNLSHCSECSDFPCRQYKKWQSVGKILPHLREASLNIEILKRHGMDTLVKEQQARWSCSTCGTPFSWYSSKCTKCGESHAAKTYSINRFKRILCRIILPLAYKKGRKTAARWAYA